MMARRELQAIADRAWATGAVTVTVRSYHTVWCNWSGLYDLIRHEAVYAQYRRWGGQLPRYKWWHDGPRHAR